MKMLAKIAFLSAAVAACAIAEDVSWIPDGVTTNYNLPIIPETYLLTDCNVEPMVIIKGSATRVEVTDPDMFWNEDEGKYYNLWVLDGACLAIKKGAYLKCRRLRLGSDSVGELPAVVAFEEDNNTYHGDFFSNCIFTGCGEEIEGYWDTKLYSQRMCEYIFFFNAVLKSEQRTYDMQHTWFAPTKECDENAYYGAKISNHQYPFWDLGKLKVEISRHWRNDKFKKLSITAANNSDGLNGIMVQNNDNVNPYPTIYWHGGHSEYPTNVVNQNNWRGENNPNSVELGLENNEFRGLMKFSAGGPDKMLTWNMCGYLNDNQYWNGSYVNFNPGICKGMEVLDSYTFGKSTIWAKDNNNEMRILESGMLDFYGSWLVGGNNVTNTVRCEALALAGNTSIYTGRQTADMDGDKFLNKGWENTALVLDCDLKGGNHMPVFSKKDNGALIVRHNVTAFTGVVEFCEGEFTVEPRVSFACTELMLRPGSGQRNTNARTKNMERVVHGTLGVMPGATVKTQRLDWEYVPEVYTSTEKDADGRPLGNVTVPFGSFGMAFTNGTLRLTGTDNVLKINETAHGGSLAGKVKISIGSEQGDTAAAMALDIEKENANCELDVDFAGSGIFEKKGLGSVKLVRQMPDSIKIKCTSGEIDFCGNDVGDRVVGGNGLIRNAQISGAAKFEGGICGGAFIGENCTISAVSVDLDGVKEIDYLRKPFTLARFELQSDAEKFAERLNREFATEENITGAKIPLNSLHHEIATIGNEVKMTLNLNPGTLIILN